MRTSLGTIRNAGKTRHYRTATAALFSAALLLSNFSGASHSVATPEDGSAEPSVSATVEEPRQETSAPVTPSPSQSARSAEPKASASPESSPTEEESPSETPSESPSESAEATPTEEATPDVTEATITVRIAGGLSGVKLQLHRGNANKAGAAIPEAWASCVSNSAGKCSFTVSETHASSDDYEAGEHYDQQFWVRQLSAPSGWYMNETLGLTGNSTAAYEFRTGPQLRAGQHYTSGSDFMAAGSNRASTGAWQNSRNNPGADLTCRPGADIAVVLDRTGSAGTSAAAAMKDAMRGTNSSVTVYDGASSLAQGLGKAAGSGHDLVVAATGGSESSAGFAPTEKAITAANTLKAQGSRVLAIGVGTSNHANLRAISGNEFSRNATYSGADYHAIGNGQLKSLLESIAQQVECETTVEVTQKTQAYDQDSAAAGGSGWKFELTTDAGTVRPDPKQTTGDNGKVSYSLDFDSAKPDPLKASLKGLLSDDQEAEGWALKQVTCSNNGTALDVAVPTAKFSVTPGDRIECTFLNTQTLKPGMTVKKQAWDTPNASDLSHAKNLAPGHSLLSGHQVTWTYEVTNTGETALHDIEVVDDQLSDDAVTCPKTTLGVGKSMTCTASGKVTAKP